MSSHWSPHQTDLWDMYCIAPQAESFARTLTEITYRLTPLAFDGLADSVYRMECRALKGCLVTTTHY